MRKKSTLKTKGFHVLTVRLLPDELALLKRAQKSLQLQLGLTRVTYTQCVVSGLRSLP